MLEIAITGLEKQGIPEKLQERYVRRISRKAIRFYRSNPLTEQPNIRTNSWVTGEKRQSLDLTITDVTIAKRVVTFFMNDSLMKPELQEILAKFICYAGDAEDAAKLLQSGKITSENAVKMLEEFKTFEFARFRRERVWSEAFRCCSGEGCEYCTNDGG